MYTDQPRRTAHRRLTFGLLLRVACLVLGAYSADATHAVVIARRHQATIADITPEKLKLLIGPLIPRDVNVPGWPRSYDAHLDAAIDRMVREVGAGSYSYVTDSADQDNPHYAPLRMVTMRNIRAGKPLDETEPGFAAALKITREFVRLYAKHSEYRVVLARNTNWADCEIVWVLFKDNPGDNGLLARECYDYLWSAANWVGWHLNPEEYGTKERLTHQWMDTRTLAMVVEMALTADRLGIPFGQTHLGSRAFVPEGVQSWKAWIEWVNGFIDRMQKKTMDQFENMTDPNGLPILFGNIRYQAPSSTAQRRTPPPYPIVFFMDGMLANALLRAWRQFGDTLSRNNAIEMVAGVKQHYDPRRHTLPYASHAAPGGRRFQGNDNDYVLANFWVRPLLEMYELTGDLWMRRAAVEMLAETSRRRSLWLWRFKQAQQLGSASESQSVQALLAGVH